jgi:hypothetical protein
MFISTVGDVIATAGHMVKKKAAVIAVKVGVTGVKFIYNKIPIDLSRFFSSITLNKAGGVAKDLVGQMEADGYFAAMNDKDKGVRKILLDAFQKVETTGMSHLR